MLTGGTSKRIGREEKRRLREGCRERLWGLERYWEEEGRFPGQLLHLYKLPVEYSADKLVGYEYSQVVSMFLKEFSGNHNHVQFSPSMQECEVQLKKLFVGGLKAREHLKAFSEHNLNAVFEPDLEEQLDRSVHKINELVGEASLMLVAVGFFLQSFEHTMLDDALILEDEVRELLEDVRVM